MDVKRKRLSEGGRSGSPRQISIAEIEEMVMSKVKDVLKNQDETLENVKQELQQLENHFDEQLKQFNVHLEKVQKRGDAALVYVRRLKNENGSLTFEEDGSDGSPMPVISNVKSMSSNSSGQVGSSLEQDQRNVSFKRKTVEGFWNSRKIKVPVVDLTDEDTKVKVEQPSWEEWTKSSVSSTQGAKSVQDISPLPVEKSSAFSASKSPPVLERIHSLSPPPSQPVIKREPDSPEQLTLEIKKEEIPFDIAGSSISTAPPQPGMSNGLSATSSGSVQQSNTVDSTVPSQESKEVASKKVLVQKSATQKDDWKRLLSPLPERPFPTELPVEAASKNLPQKLSIRLGFVTEPEPSICLYWCVNEEDPHAPAMESYYIYGAQEEDAGGKFSSWTLVGRIKATALPMACRLSNYNSPRRICFVMVGKDVYDRFGPYSEVECIYARPAKHA